jgi:AcrR family transcriptional regulator
VSRPKNADGQRTRQAILDAAFDLFADKGYFGTSLRDVARVVGIRESAIYNYFASKDALFEALIAAEQHTKLERLASIAGSAGTSGRALLEQIATASLESFLAPRQQKLFRILMSDGIRLAKLGRINLFDRLGGGRELLQDLMRRLMREGLLRTTDPHALVMAFVGPLMLWRHLHAIDADWPMLANPRAFARRHVDQFLRGAAALPARTATSQTRGSTRSRTAAERRPRSKRPSL